MTQHNYKNPSKTQDLGHVEAQVTEGKKYYDEQGWEISPPISDRMLSNTVIEDWEYTLEETEETGIGNISNDNAGTSKHHLFDN